MSATLDDVVGELRQLRSAVLVSTELVVGTVEACRRLSIGWETLDKLVKEGRIRRIQNLRGRGNSHCYAVSELVRFAEARDATNVLSIGRAS